MQASQEVIPLENASLWWASKEMQRGKHLKDHIGKNEKTKIICKLQKVSEMSLNIDLFTVHFQISLKFICMF